MVYQGNHRYVMFNRLDGFRIAHVENHCSDHHKQILLVFVMILTGVRLRVSAFPCLLNHYVC